jgi:hypothetical protein
MGNDSEAVIGIDTAKLSNAVAVAVMLSALPP